MTNAVEQDLVLTTEETPADPGLSIYEGAGIRASRLEQANECDESVLIRMDAGRVFGGDLADRQDWTILHGEGLLSWDSPFRRVRVSSGQTYRMEAGDRLLLKAETRLWLQLSRPSNPTQRMLNLLDTIKDSK